MNRMIANFGTMFFFGAVIAMGSCGLQKVEYYNVVKTASPKGDREVIWYNQDAGATTRESTAMQFVRKGVDPDYSDPALVIDDTPAVMPTIEWLSGTSVRVRLDHANVGRKSAFIKRDSQNGVSIEYVFRN